MIDKMTFAVFMAYWKLKTKFDELKDDEDGMQTIEAVILIAVAVIIALVIINLLTGKDGEEGLIQHIFTKIKEKIDGMFE